VELETCQVTLKWALWILWIRLCPLQSVPSSPIPTTCSVADTEHTQKVALILQAFLVLPSECDECTIKYWLFIINTSVPHLFLFHIFYDFSPPLGRRVSWQPVEHRLPLWAPLGTSWLKGLFLTSFTFIKYTLPSWAPVEKSESNRVSHSPQL
jgi:hypothetical protein